MSCPKLEFITIAHNCCPEVGVPWGKKHMSLVLRDWEDIYHHSVSETFDRLRKQYCEVEEDA